MPSLALRAADALAVLTAPRAWELNTMRRLLGSQPARILAHDIAPGPAPAWAFLAVDVTDAYHGALATARRFVVLLPAEAVIVFDIATARDAKTRIEWSLEGDGLARRALLPRPGDAADSAEHDFLNVLTPVATPLDPVVSIDLAGARLGRRVVLFHRDSAMAPSAVSFHLAAPGQFDFLVAGLFPGLWEVWWNGYLEQSGGLVKPRAGTLAFSGQAGSYFLRHSE